MMQTLRRMGCMCGKESIKIAGRHVYEKSRLGEGGFSYVDLVEDTISGELYALKKIACHSEEDEKTAQQEIDMHNRFSHPNILPCEAYEFVPIKEVTTSGKISECCLLLPFYKRGTLADELTQRSKGMRYMEESRVLRLFMGICEGVKAMHMTKPNPIAHRDIKTANILLTDDDVPVLMDLGSAAVARVQVTSASQANRIQDLAAERCSMPYRAPELFNVALDSTIDERTDIWSLGCVLYALMFFHSPYDAVYQRGDSIALAVISGNISFPINHNYSAEVVELVCCMLIVDANQRPMISTVLEKLSKIHQTVDPDRQTIADTNVSAGATHIMTVV